MSSFWSAWVIILTIFSLIAITWLLFSNRKSNLKLDENNEAKTGHVYDGIEEYDNPLPGWWFNLFVLTIIFSVIYLIAYPGMGNFKGLLNWTSVGQWEAATKEAEEKYAEIYEEYLQTPIEELAQNRKAVKMGQRLFANNCATCHGSDASGTTGYPNLSDNDWLYGGTPNDIVTSITYGRMGSMPAWKAVLGAEGVEDVSKYVLSLGNGNSSANSTENSTEGSPGSATYATMCMACHGADGTGNPMMGAPNLTDDVWLYGGTLDQVKESIGNGRNGQMPAHEKTLSKVKIHILATYVYGLSHKQSP